jgi:hypothetical protein
MRDEAPAAYSNSEIMKIMMLMIMIMAMLKEDIIKNKHLLYIPSVPVSQPWA